MATGLSFNTKILQANLTLVNGTFSQGLGNQVQLTGLRMECEIDKGGHPSKNTCKLKIYGMLKDDMDALTTVPGRADKPLAVHKNILQLLAGDTNGLSLSFQGEITEAFASYQSPPNMHFQVEAIEGYYAGLAPVGPSSYPGAVSVATIMANLAQQMGYAFQNNGVTAQLHNPYLSGTAMQQAADVVAAANIEFGVDNGTLFIAPRGMARPGVAPLISAETGLKEYPVFDKKGLKFECLYNPQITLGGLVVVQSAIPVCCGTWRVHGLKHNLSTLHPGGHWHSKVDASYVGG